MVRVYDRALLRSSGRIHGDPVEPSLDRFAMPSQKQGAVSAGEHDVYVLGCSAVGERGAIDWRLDGWEHSANVPQRSNEVSLPDYYAILGVAQDAEDIVISAAYRALAQRYHPDKSTSVENADERMARINEAYAVLRDSSRRAEYDRASRREASSTFESQDDTDQADAFVDAMRDSDDRWQVAKSVYPDLDLLRARLNRFSTPLAFAYVTTLLERKDFERRRELAKQFEDSFLEKYFGSNEQIIFYARELILGGHRDAAKALNRLIDVLGTPSNPQLYIEKIESEFQINAHREARAAQSTSYRQTLHLKKMVREFGYYDEAKQLARLMGYAVEEHGGGLFRDSKVRIRSGSGEVKSFDNASQFVDWVKSVIGPNTAQA